MAGLVGSLRLPMTAVFVLLLILVMVGFNALYVAAEFATVGSRRSRIQEQAESGSGQAQGLLAILQDPKRLDNYVAACQIGITLSSLVAGAYGQAQLIPLFEDWFGGASRTVAVIVVLLFITTLQVVLGELLPKTVALRYPEALSIGTLTPMRISQWLLRPLVAVFNGSAFAIMRRTGLHVDHSHTHVHSPAELAGLFEESAAGGLIDRDEQEMLAGALAVTSRVAREIMTPRVGLLTVEASSPISDALVTLSPTPYSRFPVTRNGEEIVGLVTLRDLFLAGQQGSGGIVADVAEAPTVVSEVFEVPALMRLFAGSGVHAAMVVNEFGSISGMVTREDALEEILGEVQDEFDVELDPITVSGRQVSVRGDVLLQELNARFGLALPTDQADTVSGYVWQQLGRRPAVGDVVPLTVDATQAPSEAPSASMTVEAIDGTLVSLVSFVLPAAPEGEVQA